MRGPSDISSGANQPCAHGFHESRDTKHESRPFIVCFGRRVVRMQVRSQPGLVAIMPGMMQRLVLPALLFTLAIISPAQHLPYEMVVNADHTASPIREHLTSTPTARLPTSGTPTGCTTSGFTPLVSRTPAGPTRGNSVPASASTTNPSSLRRARDRAGLLAGATRRSLENRRQASERWLLGTHRTDQRPRAAGSPACCGGFFRQGRRRMGRPFRRAAAHPGPCLGRCALGKCRYRVRTCKDFAPAHALRRSGRRVVGLLGSL